MANKIFDILNGPSKFDLMLALFDSTIECPRTVELSIEERGQGALKMRYDGCKSVITQVGREFEENEWNIKGYISTEDASLSFKGKFCTKTRKGWIIINL